MPATLTSIIRTLAIGLTLLLPALLLPAVAGAETIAFRGIDVVPMDRETVLENQTVLVVDGRIAALGPADEIDVPAEASIVDGAGRTLMPGLGEMHAHVPPADRDNLQTVLDLFLANGITTLRGVIGEPGHLRLREQLASGERAGPRLYTAGPSLNGNSVASPEDGAAKVSAYHAAGYDILKLHPGLDIARFDAIMDAAHALDIQVVGHVSEAVGLDHALNKRMHGIEHLDDYVRALAPDDHPARSASPGFFGLAATPHADAARIPELARRTVEAGTWISPTETIMVSAVGPLDSDALLTRPEFVHVDETTKASWRRLRAERFTGPGFDAGLAARFLALRRQLLKALHDAGAPILLGSDAPQWFNVPGFSAHRELALMVEAGLSPYQALRTGTVNVARHLGAGDRRGIIAKGFDADLIVIEGNPLTDIGNAARIQGVMVAGRWHDRTDLDARLEKARQAAQ